jgi:hypothetical protein
MPDASFLDAQLAYENLGAFDIDAAIAKLDNALAKFSDNKGYTGEYNTDYGGNDIWCKPYMTYEQLKTACDADSSCVGFNTVERIWGAGRDGGCIKFALSTPNNNSGGTINFYKKTNNNGGYNPEMRHDYGGNDIWCNWWTTEEVLRKTCNSDPNCLGYNRALWNTGGCVKNKNAKNGNYYPTNDFNFYTKTQHDSGEIKSVFEPVADYYSKLVALNTSLHKYISKSAKHIADAEPRLLSEERYSNRTHPEDSVMGREATGNFFKYDLKTSMLPYLIASSVFMASISIFLIFQMNGFSGQINLPPYLSQYIQYLIAPAHAPASSYMPGFIVLMVVISLVIAGILYMKRDNTNS